MVIRCYVSEYASISRLVPYLCLDPLLLHFHPLCLHISCRLPPSLQVNTHLFQSSPYNLHSQSLIRLQTQLQHRTIHNVLNYGIMAEDDVRLHLLQSCFRHWWIQRWVHSLHRHIRMWLNTHQAAGHAVVEASAVKSLTMHLKESHCLQRPSVGLEGRCHTHMSLLFYTSPVFMLWYLGAYHHGRV